jgi:transcriptional regulator with XRE-family HTH domain
MQLWPMVESLGSLAERIAWAVERSGKTLERLAEEVGCSHAAISQWQTGKTKQIQSDLLLRFADATGVELRWLLTQQGPQISRYVITEAMDRVAEALAVIAREEPLQVDTIVRMVEAAAQRGKAN